MAGRRRDRRSSRASQVQCPRLVTVLYAPLRVPTAKKAMVRAHLDKLSQRSHEVRVLSPFSFARPTPVVRLLCADGNQKLMKMDESYVCRSAGVTQSSVRRAIGIRKGCNMEIFNPEQFQFFKSVASLCRRSRLDIPSHERRQNRRGGGRLDWRGSFPVPASAGPSEKISRSPYAVEGREEPSWWQPSVQSSNLEICSATAALWQSS